MDVTLQVSHSINGRTALDPIKIVTPSYAFSKNCDEDL